MQFNCSACGTPHEFPDEEIPAEGIVVACSNCAAHIALDAPGAHADPPLAATSAAQAALGGFDNNPFGPEDPGATSATEAVPRQSEPQPPGPSLDKGGKPSKSEKPAKGEKPAKEPKAPKEPKAKKEPKAPKEPGEPGAEGGRIARMVANIKAAADASRIAMEEAAGEAMADATPPASHGGFGAHEGRWSWRDLPRMFLGIMDLKRVVLITAGFWAVLAAFGIVQWLAGFLGGIFGPLGGILGAAAWVVFVGGGALVGGVAGYVMYRTVIEDEPTTVQEGLTWARASIKGVVGTPLVFAAIIIGFSVLMGTVGVLGRVPFAGPIIWGAVSPVMFALSLIAGVVAVAMVWCLPLYIPVVLKEETGPKETLLRLLNLFRSNGAPLIGHLLGAVVLSVLGYLLMVLPAVGAAKYLFTKAGIDGMGDNFLKTMASAPSGLGSMETGLLRGFAGDTNFGHSLGGFLAGIGGQLPTAFTLAVVVLVYYTAGAIIYAAISDRRKR